MKRLFWNMYARVYDLLPMFFIPYKLQLQRVIDIVNERHGMESWPQILDVGCGTGNYAGAFEKKDYCVWGLDNSKPMLRCARKKSSVTYIEASFTEELPFASNKLACIISINSLYMECSIYKILEEFNRVLKPRGTLIISTPQMFPDFLEIVGDYIKQYGIWSILYSIIPLSLLSIFHWIIGGYFERGCWCLYTRSDIEPILSRVGFRVMSAELSYACNSNLLIVAENIRRR